MVSKLIFDFHFFSFRRTRTRAEENFHKLDQFSSVKGKCVSRRSIFFHLQETQWNKFLCDKSRSDIMLCFAGRYLITITITWRQFSMGWF